MNNSWLPQDYELPTTSGGNYMKFDQGQNKFRVMSAPIMGWVYWTDDKKPVRLENEPEELPVNIRKGDKIKHFWAFIVWNYKAGKIQILEITQSSIQRSMQDLVMNEDWGDPKQYDITVAKKGEKLDTEYSVQPSPHKPPPQESLSALMATPINLKALFEGADPFAPSEITREDTPFS